MKHTYLIIAILIITACRSNESESTDQVFTNSPSVTQLEKSKKVDLIHEKPKIEKSKPIDSLPIHGPMNDSLLKKYYPGLTDTIKDLRIVFAEQLDMMLNQDVYVSILFNAGTFQQMFLCSHDNNFKLVDNTYIGIGTMFDQNSHTINYTIINDSNIRFDHVDWGYVEEEIDSVSSKSYEISISDQGKMRKSK